MCVLVDCTSVRNSGEQLQMDEWRLGVVCEFQASFSCGHEKSNHFYRYTLHLILHILNIVESSLHSFI